jgi:fatty acid desaturase
LKQDLKILKQLPEESTARQRLLEHIDKEIISLIESDEEKTRRPTGIVLAIVFLGLAIFLLVEAITRAGWWWWLVLPAAVIGIFGAVGLSQDAVSRKRDEKGNVI